MSNFPRKLLFEIVIDDKFIHKTYQILTGGNKILIKNELIKI